MSDDNSLDGFFAAQEALSRLTPAQLDALDTELRWIRAQREAGRLPSPEKLVAKAPTYLRVLAYMGDD